ILSAIAENKRSYFLTETHPGHTNRVSSVNNVLIRYKTRMVLKKKLILVSSLKGREDNAKV
ncbi:hypothetical protein CHS0354_030232, partial [Potamilus streckersoni]